LKPDDPSKVIVSVIAGNPTPFRVSLDGGGHPVLDPSCDSPIGHADPAVRLAELVSEVPGSSMASVCASDLAPALDAVVPSLGALFVGQCLDPRVDSTDLDPHAPGDQIACSFETGRDAPPTPLPQCVLAADGVTPIFPEASCWYVFADPTACPDTPAHLVIRAQHVGFGADGRCDLRASGP
jgi:hypothetical protein